MDNPNSLHLVETKQQVAGKKRPLRLKAKHFSAWQREIITAMLDTHMSCEDVARELTQRGGFEGITPQAVQDVAIIYLLRRPPASERFAFSTGARGVA